jgi:hypothetical protein
MRTTGKWKGFRMQLPERPNLRHLRDQAKDLVRTGAAATVAEAQFQIARQYGFPSWPKLKQQVAQREKASQLKQAIATGEVAAVEKLLAASPEFRLLLIEELMCASQPGQTAKMEFLVRAGADVNGRCWGWFSGYLLSVRKCPTRTAEVASRSRHRRELHSTQNWSHRTRLPYRYLSPCSQEARDVHRIAPGRRRPHTLRCSWRPPDPSGPQRRTRRLA